MSNPSIFHEFLAQREEALINAWTEEQKNSASKQGSIRSDELRDQCTDVLTSLKAALEKGPNSDFHSAAYDDLREKVGSIARARAMLGFSPTETALFIFSLKRPLFLMLQEDYASHPETMGFLLVASSKILDDIGLYTTEVFLKTREEVIHRQNQDLMELSTPVVKLWDGVLALPLIGTLDSARTQVVMESLLQRIVETGADVAIIDITGVPTVDTLVAQHLLKTVTAARLMGAECIISGIRPQIAQTIVHLGVNLGDVITKASLAEAFKIAISKAGLMVTKRSSSRE